MRKHSAISPLSCARNTTKYYYKTPDFWPSLKVLIGDEYVQEHRMHPVAKSAVKVAFLYILRISEVLQLTVGDVVTADRVICRGKKKSRSSLLWLPDIKSQLTYFPGATADTRLFPVTYLQCYRSCVISGIHTIRQEMKNKAATHLSRYVFAQYVSKDLSASELQDLMKHNNINSQSFYLQRGDVQYGNH